MALGEISLNSSLLAGRIRPFDRHEYARRPVQRVAPRGISDVFTPTTKTQLASLKTPVIVKPEATELVAKPMHDMPSLPPTSLRNPQPSVVLSRKYAAKPSTKISRHRPNSSTILMAFAVLLIVAGATVAFMGWHTNRKVVAQVQGLTQQQNDNSAPEESKPSPAAYGSYSVAPDLPRYVRIPKLGVVAMVQRQGVDKNGALKAPGNVHVAGWYDGSSKPGDGGAMLLDGHVAGPTQQGVFYNLKKLVAGDKIEVERGDGKVFSYKVVKSVSAKADKVDMASALLPVVDGKPGLNLITCTGNISGVHYDDRLVVYATQI